MAADHFLVARINPSPIGDVTFEAIATSLGRGAATALAVDRVARTGELILVGSPRLRRVDVFLPDRVRALALTPPSILTARLAGWIDLLRSHGDLSLTMLAESRVSTRIPPTRLVDPQVLAALSVLLTSIPHCEDRDALEPEVWVAAASPNSLAALMRDSSYAIEFEEWIESVPRASRPSLRIPLFHVDSNACHRMLVGAWVRRNPGHPFVAGEALQVAVEDDGQVTAWMQPVCRDGETWTSGTAAPQSTDSAWGYRADVRLGRFLHHLPPMAERLLLESAGEAIQAGASPSRVLDCLPAFRRHLDRQLRDTACTVTAQLLQKTGLEGAISPRLSHAQYLHAQGDRDVSARRRQAFATWPALFADVLAGNLPATRDAINSSHPLVKALAADVQVPSWAVRRLLKLLGQLPSRATQEFCGPAGLARLIAMAGAQAPEMSPNDLDSIAHWMRLLPLGIDDPGTGALMRALGAEAANAGWEGVAALLARPEIGEEALPLLAWWDDLRQNVADVLMRNATSVVSKEKVETTFLAWVEHVPMTTALRLAAGWHGLLWGTISTDDHAASGVQEVRTVFGTMSLLPSRVQVTPINTLAALREEGARMHHCVATYWRAVAGARRLVCALQCPDTGARATAAWAYQPTANWTRSDAAGEGNAVIREGSPIAAALAEMECLLADEHIQNAEAIQNHQRAAAVHLAKGADFAVGGACLVSLLPPILARTALRFLPGAGDLSHRVYCAARNAIGSDHSQVSANH